LNADLQGVLQLLPYLCYMPQEKLSSAVFESLGQVPQFLQDACLPRMPEARQLFEALRETLLHGVQVVHAWFLKITYNNRVRVMRTDARRERVSAPLLLFTPSTLPLLFLLILDNSHLLLEVAPLSLRCPPLRSLFLSTAATSHLLSGVGVEKSLLGGSLLERT